MTTPQPADGSPDRPASPMTAAQRLALALGTSAVADDPGPDPVDESVPDGR